METEVPGLFGKPHVHPSVPRTAVHLSPPHFMLLEEEESSVEFETADRLQEDLDDTVFFESDGDLGLE